MNIEKLADELSFNVKDMLKIIKCMQHHKPTLKTNEDFINEWITVWFRNYSFEDIVEYEMQYFNDYFENDLTDEDMFNKLKAFLTKNYVKTLRNKPTESWTIYKISNKLWIERNC